MDERDKKEIREKVDRLELGSNVVVVKMSARDIEKYIYKKAENDV